MLVGNGELFRYTKKRFDRVILIGNGAIENGWAPLKAALKIQGTADFLAARLASDAVSYRTARTDLMRLLAFEHDEREDAEFDRLKRVIREAHATRCVVGKEYATASTDGTLSLRRCSRIEEFLYSPNTAIITTNWDEILWNDSRVANIIQLHGRSSLPESLIFPSELRAEDELYRAILRQPKASKTFEKLKLRDIFLPRSRSGLYNAEILASELIAFAKELYVWGLAAHAYDAELINTLEILGNVVPKEWEEKLFIINPDSAARDRIASLLEMKCSDRFDLDFATDQWITGAKQ